MDVIIGDIIEYEIKNDWLTGKLLSINKDGAYEIEHSDGTVGHIPKGCNIRKKKCNKEHPYVSEQVNAASNVIKDLALDQKKDCVNSKKTIPTNTKNPVRSNKTNKFKSQELHSDEKSIKSLGSQKEEINKSSESVSVKCEIDLKEFQRNPEVLNLSSNGYNDTNITIISSLINAHTTYITLYLNGNNIGDNGAQILVEGLKLNKTLTHLDLGGNQIKDVAAESIAVWLADNTTLTYLDLDENMIANAGASALGKALMTNKVLKVLILESNLIENEGAIDLAEGLKINFTPGTFVTLQNIPEHWDFSNGQVAKVIKLLPNKKIAISVDMKQAFAFPCPFLKQDKTSLLWLDLDQNKIGDTGVCALGEALKTNTVLTKLCLEGNRITDKGGYGLMNGLKENRKLKTLYLHMNGLTSEVKLKFFEIKEKHKTLFTLYA